MTIDTESGLIFRSRVARNLCRLVNDMKAAPGPDRCFCLDFQAALDKQAAETWLRAASQAQIAIQTQTSLETVRDQYRQEAIAIYEVRRHQAQAEDGEDE